MALTDIQVRNAKASDASRKLPDGSGLYLFISKAGGKSWRFDYSYFGKRKTLTLGMYPAVGLAEARGRKDDAKESWPRGTTLAREKAAATGSKGGCWQHVWPDR
ncbi:Arm DNA-binding domain-containing protein [Aliirhizobium terrae]|uniref:Arm DNA-binding domain-containing protein n=1 Tax=Terrirhizobium terrae TaxID=2926709 RepID=UPI002578810C|nr:Arm DNA-binding domain-containing protein [Rhizobium sp. CC-CFT758]WJH42118.1 Arm DNA-binding domain-containing protein [Rhizobium sp. CC-CFT758]